MALWRTITSRAMRTRVPRPFTTSSDDDAPVQRELREPAGDGGSSGASVRQRRVAWAIERHVGGYLERHGARLPVADIDPTFTLTAVDVSGDLQLAWLRWAVSQPRAPIVDAIHDTLQRGGPALRFSLAAAMHQRRVPVLRFLYDTRGDRTQHILDIIDHHRRGDRRRRSRARRTDDDVDDDDDEYHDDVDDMLSADYRDPDLTRPRTPEQAALLRALERVVQVPAKIVSRRR